MEKFKIQGLTPSSFVADLGKDSCSECLCREIHANKISGICNTVTGESRKERYLIENECIMRESMKSCMSSSPGFSALCENESKALEIVETLFPKCSDIKATKPKRPQRPPVGYPDDPIY